MNQEDLTIFADNTRIRNPAAARRLRQTFALMRNAAMLLPFAPGVLRWGDVYYIPGHDDALAALASDQMFATPYGPAMRKLDTNQKVSLLGFDQTAAGEASYQKNLCEVMRAMPLDLARRMSKTAEAKMTEIFGKKAERLDLMTDLLIPVTLHVTAEHYGMTFTDGPAFLQWLMAILVYVFGPPAKVAHEELAAEAAGRLMDADIARNLADAPPAKDTILGAMKNIGMSDETIQATLAGLLVGGMPTITQAGYNIMEVLLSNRRAMAMASNAARDGDDETLRRCLGEALRFRPVLPVMFRKSVAPPAALRAGGCSLPRGPVDWLGRPIPSGADVCLLGLTANFDPRSVRSPRRFDPARPLTDSLAFGQGKHFCLGVAMAMAVLVAVFRPLLLSGPIRRRKFAPRPTYFVDYFAESFEIGLGEEGA